MNTGDQPCLTGWKKDNSNALNDPWTLRSRLYPPGMFRRACLACISKAEIFQKAASVSKPIPSRSMASICLQDVLLRGKTVFGSVSSSFRKNRH